MFCDRAMLKVPPHERRGFRSTHHQLLLHAAAESNSNPPPNSHRHQIKFHPFQRSRRLRFRVSHVPKAVRTEVLAPQMPVPTFSLTKPRRSVPNFDLPLVFGRQVLWRLKEESRTLVLYWSFGSVFSRSNRDKFHLSGLIHRSTNPKRDPST